MTAYRGTKREALSILRGQPLPQREALLLETRALVEYLLTKRSKVVRLDREGLRWLLDDLIDELDPPLDSQ